MTKAWHTPLFAVATVYFIIDVVFSHVTRPVTAWLGKMKILVRLRRWITSLAPYPSFALLAVPVVILERAKPLSDYLIARGHFIAGAVVFITAEVLKLTIVDRLFQLNKEKLLSIPVFAWGYEYWRRMMDFLESTKAWQASRKMVLKAVGWCRALGANQRLLRCMSPVVAQSGHCARQCPVLSKKPTSGRRGNRRFQFPGTSRIIPVP